LGYRIPQDLSIVGHDDVPLAQLVNPPLTTVRVDCMDLAKAALDMLFGLLEDPGLSPKPQIVPTELVIRDTAGAPPYISSAGAFTALTTPAGINDSPGIIAGNLDE
jgi:DNA-binding LacI/PurR family transcriptional regulator